MANTCTAEYMQRGEVIDYVNSTEAAIPAGTLIQLGDAVGVTGTDIPPNGVGSVHIEGVFRFANDSKTIGLGKVVYLKDGKVSDTKEGDELRLGHSIRESKPEDPYVYVKINV